MLPRTPLEGRARRLLRRALTVTLPIVAIVLLAIVGRSIRTTPAIAEGAPLSEAGIGSALVDLADATTPPADVVADAPDAPRDASPNALEVLDDGGVIVDLNLANEDELRRLPGIGVVRARAILALRAKLGRLKSVDDLARIKGFGRTILRRLRPLTRASKP